MERSKMLRPTEVGVQRPDDTDASASLGVHAPEPWNGPHLLPPDAKIGSEGLEDTFVAPGEMPNAIHNALLEVMGGGLYVKKSGWNSYHKYKFATVDDVYAAVRPLLVKAGLTVLALPEGRAETFVTPDGNAWVKQDFRIQLNCDGYQYSPDNMTFMVADVIKGPQTFGGLRSYAKKYWLREALMIETGEGDIDGRHGEKDDVAAVTSAVSPKLDASASKEAADKIVLALDMAQTDAEIEAVVRSEATNVYPRLAPADQSRLDTALSTARDRLAVNQAPPK